MAEEGEDPFGSLIKFCQPTSSQESKFQNCPFAREPEIFPDSFDSSPEQPPPQLEPVGIIIASPPETEDFLTPPEHHNPSNSTSQEDPQRLKPETTVVVDDEYVESEANVALRKGEENLGFTLETEKIDSSDDDDLGEKEVGEIEGFESELKRFRIFESELDTSRSKKIRVSEENWDSDKLNDTEIIDLETTTDEDSEKSDEVRECGAGTTEAGKSEKCGSDGDVDHSEKEKGIDLDGGGNCLKVNRSLVLKESEEGDRDNSNSEVQRDGKAVSAGSSIVETRKKFGRRSKKRKNFRRGSPGNGVASAVKERVLRDGDILPSPIKEKDMGGDELIRNTEEVEKSKNSDCYNDINQREKEQDVACNGGDEHLKVNGTSALEESEKRIRHKSNNKVQRNGKAVLSSSITEKIDKFGYDGPANGFLDHSSKESVARERRELPSSITGKEKDMGGEENGGYVKVKNNGSWKNLVDALEAVFGKAEDGCEELDFLETAKKWGITFPEPRWIDD